jgi:pimeloyl-CoA synthetase
MRIHQEGLHLSGAEDLVPVQNLGIRLQEFTERFFPFLENATTVPPPKLNFTIDPVPQKNILKKSLLSVRTLNTQSCGESHDHAQSVFLFFSNRN